MIRRLWCVAFLLLTFVAPCVTALGGCGGDLDCRGEDCDDEPVSAFGSTSGTANASAILSANGTYGAACRLNPNGAWSVAMVMGAPLDSAALTVAKNDVACTLSLVSLRTGSGPSNLYTASSPMPLGIVYAAAALFTSPQDSLAVNAKLSAISYASSFALTVLVSDNVQIGASGASTYFAYDGRVLVDTPLSYWRLDDALPSTLGSDPFTGTAGTTLQARVAPPVTWTKHTASTTDVVLSSGGRARVGTNKKAVYLATTAPGSADYAVSADVYVASLLQNDQAGVIARAASATETYYYAGLVETYALFTQTRRLELWRYTAGIGALLGSFDDAHTAGTTRRVQLEVRGTRIRASLDGIERIVVTDNVISAAGSAGLVQGVNLGNTPSDSAGLHLDNLSLRAAGEARDSKAVNHGLYANGVTRQATGALSVANAAASFDGVDDYIELARQIGDDFSIELWFKSTQGIGNASALQWHQTAGLFDGGAAQSNSDFGVGLRADGRILAGTGKTSCVLLVLCGDDDQTLVSSGTTAYNDGAWHHVVFTRAKAAGAMALYVDGAQAGSLASGGATHTLDAATYLSIGRLQTGTNYFAGSIDEVAVYSSVLSAQTVLYHYNAGRH